MSNPFSEYEFALSANKVYIQVDDSLMQVVKVEIDGTTWEPVDAVVRDDIECIARSRTMSLDEAIERAKSRSQDTTLGRLADNHGRIAEWLTELRSRRIHEVVEGKQPVIVHDDKRGVLTKDQKERILTWEKEERALADQTGSWDFSSMNFRPNEPIANKLAEYIGKKVAPGAGRETEERAKVEFLIRAVGELFLRVGDVERMARR